MNTKQKDSSSQKRVALVTGSSVGIGKAICEFLLNSDYRVFGCSRGTINWTSENYTHANCDVSDEKQVVRMIRHIYRTTGRLDVAINNAGIARMNHSLLTPASTLRKLLDTNVVGTFTVSREAAKVMKSSNYGRIINLSSIAVPLHLKGQSAYVASKSAVEGLSKVLARELAEFGITVNVIGPAPIDTAMIKGIPSERLSSVIQQTNTQLLGSVEDVFPAIKFLIDPGSDNITGQVIYLGGIS